MSNNGFPRHLSTLNSMAEDKPYDSSILKTLADDKLYVSETIRIVNVPVENIFGKGENAGNQHFLLFQRCFQRVVPRLHQRIEIASRS